MRIGIIGGTGQMGTLFTRVFQDAGHEVRVSGRNTTLKNPDLVLMSDLIMVSVPISSTIRVIEEIVHLLTEEQIICDLTSLKKGPVTAMLKGKAEVIGLHPMFGPTVTSLEGQTIVATPARCSPGNQEMILSLFSSQGARVTITDPDHHDRMMAVIQGLTHFKALVMADAMRRLGITPDETEPFMSPVYRIESTIAGRILAQDPWLYADILCENPAVSTVTTACLEAAADLAEIIAGHDTGAFTEWFIRDREWFGEYCDRSQQETDRLITSMVHT